MENKKIEYRVEGIEDGNFNYQESIIEIKKFLTKLGEEGWDLISVIPTSQSQHKTDKWGSDRYSINLEKSIFIFKRVTQ